MTCLDIHRKRTWELAWVIEGNLCKFRNFYSGPVEIVLTRPIVKCTKEDICRFPHSKVAFLIKEWGKKLNWVNFSHLRHSTLPAGNSTCLKRWRQIRCSQNVSHTVIDRPFTLRGHVTSFLWKWKLYDFFFKKRLVGHIFNKIIVILFCKPAPFS